MLLATSHSWCRLSQCLQFVANSAPCSNTIRTARKRTSAEYRFDVFDFSIAQPLKVQSLRQTRRGSLPSWRPFHVVILPVPLRPSPALLRRLWPVRAQGRALFSLAARSANATPASARDRVRSLALATSASKAAFASTCADANAARSVLITK